MPILDKTEEIEYVSGTTWNITANGGSLSINRKLDDGTWVAVENSPVADGTERQVTTITAGGHLQFIPSTPGMFYGFGPYIQA